MKRLLTFFYAAAVLVFLTTPVLAAPTTDSFDIYFDNGGYFGSGGGTGYDDDTGISPWYYYDNTGWYNQWFYDDPPDPYRYKEISYDINIDFEYVTDFKIAINWSTLDYPETGPDGPPPLPPLSTSDEELYIHREIILEGSGFDIPSEIIGTFTIPDYNPEWVSIDIWVYDNKENLSIYGTITHECVPVPSAILLGSLGAGLVGLLRRRRTI